MEKSNLKIPKKRIEEDIISHATAILAESKGFDQRPYMKYVYTPDGVKWQQHGVRNFPRVLFPDFSDAPTQSILQKWLRIEHNIIVQPHPVIYTGHDEVAYYDVAIKGNHQMIKYNTWEEAFEYGLEKALKTLKSI